jgi:putative ABC transport system permease protein
MLSLEGLKLVWPGVSAQQAVGRFLSLPDESPREVLAIVSDVRPAYAAPISPTLYVPVGSERFGSMAFAVRITPGTTLNATDLLRRFRDRGVTPTGVQITKVADRFTNGTTDQSFRAMLFSGFALVALVLAIVGIYAVQAFAVTQRRSELAIRMSLGATPGAVQRLLIAEALRPALAGVLIGLVAAVSGSAFVEKFLFGVDARDPWVLAGVALLLILVAVSTVWSPGRRITSDNDLSRIFRAP